MGQGDEGDVGDDHLGRVGQVARGDVADVGAAHLDDARVAGDARVELAVADVERDHTPRAAAQQHFGEASGGGADV